MKQILRKAKLNERDCADINIRRNCSIVISGNIKNIITKIGVRAIAGYHPIGSEVDIRKLLIQLHKIGCEISLPAIDSSDKLIFKYWDTIKLIKGRYQIMEPTLDSKITSPELIIVPLIAFDANCGRLGYGRGYYDIFLHSNSKKTTIGVGYSFQQVQKIYTNELDFQLDFIVTENSIFYANTQRG